MSETNVKRTELGTVAAGIYQLKQDLAALEARKGALLDELVPGFDKDMVARNKKTLFIECGDGINYTVKRADFKVVEYPLDILEELANKDADRQAAIKKGVADIDADVENIKMRGDADPRTTRGVMPRWTVSCA